MRISIAIIGSLLISSAIAVTCGDILSCYPSISAMRG